MFHVQLDGTWSNKDGTHVVDVQCQDDAPDHQIYMATYRDGEERTLKARGGHLHMDVDDELVSAPLGNPQVLAWDDGDVWFKHPPAWMKDPDDILDGLLDDAGEIPEDIPTSPKGAEHRIDPEFNNCAVTFDQLHLVHTRMSDAEMQKYWAKLKPAKAGPCGKLSAASNRFCPHCGGAMGGFDKEETSFQTSIGKGIVGNPAEYRVMQGVVFTKKGSDPTIQEIARKKQEEGTILKTTGKRWTSDTGNEWVQLDNDDQPGWSLVQGSGVGVPGPILQKIQPGEEQPWILRALVPTEETMMGDEAKSRKLVIKPSATFKEVKPWLSLLLDLEMSRMRIFKPEHLRPSAGKFVVWHNLGDEEFVEDGVTVREAGFKDGDEIKVMFMGLMP